jgi:hypothetical protein
MMLLMPILVATIEECMAIVYSGPTQWIPAGCNANLFVVTGLSLVLLVTRGIVHVLLAGGPCEHRRQRACSLSTQCCILQPIK